MTTRNRLVKQKDIIASASHDFIIHELRKHYRLLHFHFLSPKRGTIDNHPQCLPYEMHSAIFARYFETLHSIDRSKYTLKLENGLPPSENSDLGFSEDEDNGSGYLIDLLDRLPL